MLAVGGAEAVAMEPPKAAPAVGPKVVRADPIQGVPSVPAVMTNRPELVDRVTRAAGETLAATANPPAQADLGRPVAPAMIDAAHGRTVPIEMIAKTVIAAVFRALSGATEGFDRVMPPNAPPNSRSMTGLRSPTTLRPRIWTSLRCVAFMAWPTSLSTGLPVTS